MFKHNFLIVVCIFLRGCCNKINVGLLGIENTNIFIKLLLILLL